jgi:NTP pyrophosphatase (non-canonical NTP hydrolase)
VKQLQQEHKAWLVHAFPNQPLEDPAAGLVEEAGELLHAVLKYQQTLTWGSEPRYIAVDWRDKLEDAIGDCAIYACSWCNAADKCFGAVVAEAHPLSKDTVMQTALHIVNISVKFNEAYSLCTLVEYISYLMGIADLHHLNFHEAVLHTWEKVKRRKRCV